MYAVSARFLETVQGSHRAVARARLCAPGQYGTNPAGTDVPLLAGSVRLMASSDVKAQLKITVPGDWWDDVQPFGAEFFVERGVAFGDSTEEYVPLGYFPLEDPEQSEAPYGPVTLECDDRIGAMMERCRIVIPWQIASGTTHRTVLERIVNGNPDGLGTYGMYRLAGGDPVPIHWEAAGYDPDAATVDSGPLVDDSGYEYVAKLVGSRGCILRFRPDGHLEVVAANPPVDAPPVYALRAGRTGTLKRWRRKTTSRGAINAVRAVGSDVQHSTGYRLARVIDPASPLRYNGPMGLRLRYYASPLLENDAQADEAAATLLGRQASGLPTETQLWTVPSPMLQPLDVVSAPSGQGIGTYVLDEVELPLVGGGETSIRNRTLNPAVVVETPPTPEPTPDPDPGPGPDPDPGPGPGPGGGDPTDGVQAAIRYGWGPVIDGTECEGAISPKWGLYNSPGHAGNGLRRPEAFSQSDGILTITGDNNDVSGGAAFQRSSYGYRMEWQARLFQDGTSPGDRTDRYHGVLILWPSNDVWPAGAEYDHYECDEGTGQFNLFMHLPNHTPYRQDHFAMPLDLTAWHTFACDWNPVAQVLDAYVDGERVYAGRGRVAQAPGPMHPTFQLDHFGGRPRRAKFQIRYLRIYTPGNA